MLDTLRRYAIARSLFPPMRLSAALRRLQFVQADPIRAPARAQDLVLRHRVLGYRQGDLDRAYPSLALEEAFFINYGFVTAPLYRAMHPRPVPAATARRARKLLRFIHERKVVHPREVERHFQPGTVRNWWGGQSTATTQLLSELHYHGRLRVVRREGGIRLWGPSRFEPTDAPASDRIDRLIDAVVGVYAPMPEASLRATLQRLRYAVPHLRTELKAGMQRAQRRLRHEQSWFWPEGERATGEVDQQVRLLTPFDPVVWDRRRFEYLWGWPYRFEAYTPKAKRRFGYYALPVLYGDRVLGWANIDPSIEWNWVGRARPPKRALEAELERFQEFLKGTP